MANTNISWRPIPIHCPSCGTLVHGHWRCDNSAKLRCSACKTDIVVHRRGRRHNQIDTYTT